MVKVKRLQVSLAWGPAKGKGLLFIKFKSEKFSFSEQK